MKSFAENFDELQPACVPSFIDDMIDEPINSLHNSSIVFFKSNLDHNFNITQFQICILSKGSKAQNGRRLTYKKCHFLVGNNKNHPKFDELESNFANL